MTSVKDSVDKIGISLNFSNVFAFLVLGKWEIDVFKMPANQTKFLLTESVIVKMVSSDRSNFAGQFLVVLTISNGRFLLVFANLGS